jgi:hypothetical protein
MLPNIIFEYLNWHFKNQNFLKKMYLFFKNSKNWLRDLYEVSIISYGSLVFFYKPLSMTKLPWGVKFRGLEWAVKGVTKLHNGWETSSPRQINFFRDGDNDQNWPYQHLVPIFIQLPTRKNEHLMNRFIWDFSGFLFKKPDDVTWFDGIH